VSLATRLWILAAVLAAGILGGLLFRERPADPLQERIAALESSLEALARGASAEISSAKGREEEAAAALQSARTSAADARTEALAAKAAVERLRQELAALAAAGGKEEDAREIRDPELAERVAALEKRVRELEARPAAVGGTEAAARPAVPPPPPPLGPTAVRDPAHVRKVTDGLTALLAKVPGTETWRIVSAEALDGDRLVDAVLEARDPSGEVRRTLRTREVRFLLDGGARTLALRFREGSVTYPGGRAAPFPEDPFTVLLPVDPEPFRVSGNPLLTLL
jgi:hypothetical protein